MPVSDELRHLWASHTPARFDGRARLLGIAGGVLIVGVDNAATRDELDALLRTDATDALGHVRLRITPDLWRIPDGSGPAQLAACAPLAYRRFLEYLATLLDTGSAATFTAGDVLDVTEIYPVLADPLIAAALRAGIVRLAETDPLTWAVAPEAGDAIRACVKELNDCCGH